MHDIITILLEPLTFPFIQRALVFGVFVGIVCSVLSCYLILKGWSLIGDAISHALLPGIILSHIIGIPMILGALFAGILSTTLMGKLKRNSKLKEDCVVGIVFSSMFALGLFLFSVIETELHITHILFGNILGVDKTQLITNLLILFSVLVILFVKGKDLMLFCFDEKQMTMQGLSVKLHNYLLLVLLSVVIVISMQAVGVLFVIGLLIVPGMFGYNCSKQFHLMVLYAILFSTLTIILGILCSFYFDVASAPLIIVIQTCVLLFSFALKNLRIKINKKREKQLIKTIINRIGY